MADRERFPLDLTSQQLDFLGMLSFRLEILVRPRRLSTAPRSSSMRWSVAASPPKPGPASWCSAVT